MQKHTKEIITGVAVILITGIITGITTTISGAFTKIDFLEKEIAVLRQNYEKEMAMLRQSSKTYDVDIDALKKSRERLSDYYVTRREFNSTVELWNSKTDKQDLKLDRIIDMIIKQK